MSTPSPVGALQRRLALEHEAVWLASLVAGRFSALRDASSDALVRHRRSRDSLIARVAAAGATPVGPQASYGTAPATADDARQRLADVSDRLCTATLPLVTLGGAGDRREALASLRASALEAIDWGASPTAFPGLG
ncbi:hypothetical protein ASF37_02180 [Aeromicrobium sp. Leaf289]|uniref:DUF4439 domain-containing protein n=1 Tax=Aeromicrobium sp. Leaf289 TaxID=1736324 RepID=UPI0006F3728B|nr:DUF4439 domain-containing protein [Aeromicrobium sp. Leaf289]KQP79839.1 hypothetical protein ASF37_02180 [Aeromicrobium sp. Leaf289]